jgi:hypothetical protein
MFCTIGDSGGRVRAGLLEDSVIQNYPVAPPAKVRPVLLVHAFCLAFWLLSIATFRGPLRQLLSLSLTDDDG